MSERYGLATEGLAAAPSCPRLTMVLVHVAVLMLQAGAIPLLAAPLTLGIALLLR